MVTNKILQDAPDPDRSGNHLWHMRWFFAVMLSLWLIAAIAVPIIVFCITRSSLSFTLFTTIAPPSYLLYRFLCFLLPKSKDELDLERDRIKLRLEIQQAKNMEKHSKSPLHLVHTSRQRPKTLDSDE